MPFLMRCFNKNKIIKRQCVDDKIKKLKSTFTPMIYSAWRGGVFTEMDSDFRSLRGLCQR